MKRGRFHGLPFVAFGLIAVAAASLITMSLWNSLMPAIFRLPRIDGWQALGLLLLGRLLFGGFRGPRGRWNRRARFARGLESLTPEERERFRATMRNRCGSGAETAEPAAGV